MDLGLAGKVALVTGSSSGIGLATAIGFASEGCHIVLSGRNAEKVEAARAKIPALAASITTICADVTVKADAQQLMDTVVAIHGGLDILVNNVGGAVGARKVLDSTDEEWFRTFEQNVFQTVRMMRCAAPHMTGRPGAAIINIASCSGWVPAWAGSGQYAGAKAAIIHDTERWAVEFADRGIRVNTVSPGAILNEGGGWDLFRLSNPEEFTAYLKIAFPMGRLGEAEEVANVIAFLASPKSNWVNGRHVPVDGLQQPYPTSKLQTERY